MRDLLDTALAIFVCGVLSWITFPYFGLLVPVALVLLSVSILSAAKSGRDENKMSNDDRTLIAILFLAISIASGLAAVQFWETSGWIYLPCSFISFLFAGAVVERRKE